MSDIQLSRLAELESIIERGLSSFMDVGMALLEIRDGRLYKVAGHGSFEDYANNRWPQMTRTHADRLIKAASVSAELAPMGVTFKSERQTRELTPLAPEQRAEVVERFAAEDRDISTATAKEIHEVVAEVVPPKKPKPIRRPQREAPDAHQQVIELVRYKLTDIRKEYALVSYWQPVWDAIDALNRGSE